MYRKTDLNMFYGDRKKEAFSWMHLLFAGIFVVFAFITLSLTIPNTLNMRNLYKTGHKTTGEIVSYYTATSIRISNLSVFSNVYAPCVRFNDADGQTYEVKLKKPWFNSDEDAKSAIGKSIEIFTDGIGKAVYAKELEPYPWSMISLAIIFLICGVLVVYFWFNSWDKQVYRIVKNGECIKARLRFAKNRLLKGMLFKSFKIEVISEGRTVFFSTPLMFSSQEIEKLMSNNNRIMSCLVYKRKAIVFKTNEKE